MDLTLARDHSPEAAALPGMSLGTVPLTDGLSAEALFADGCRRVVFPAPIAPLTDAAVALRALRLIRDLTSRAIAVTWRLSFEEVEDWRDLAHLFPPRNAPDGWRSDYQFGHLAERRGPGLLQIRDRRRPGLRRYTLTDPSDLAAVAALTPGCAATAVPETARDRLAALRLVLPVGNGLLWLPYRMRRWPDVR
ncbi:DUF5825 family protein [Actinocorallia sp. B10E7]|uniref:DUF5825 family protein n=1 Tax=Actinocorallia sp. B10E7 TaxID=3153558 RepID=UPI00325DF563